MGPFRTVQFPPATTTLGIPTVADWVLSQVRGDLFPSLSVKNRLEIRMLAQGTAPLLCCRIPTPVPYPGSHTDPTPSHALQVGPRTFAPADR